MNLAESAGACVSSGLQSDWALAKRNIQYSRDLRTELEFVVDRRVVVVVGQLVYSELAAAKYSAFLWHNKCAAS